ncbi:hypothetical protein [Oricola nitratireducens]|uniref:hypothetical protein n=1 Tax=Oricola nitratireducens TaxID=2775868 RepID=UPI001867A7E7|nr:hypothetical protein [Oricola nitratireducens]
MYLLIVLGFRSDPTTPRYAIVNGAAAPFVLLNADAESRLRFPADCSEEAAKVTWLYREFERIFHTHPNIDRVVIKKGEFTQGDNNAKRVASYQEAALLLYCGLHNKPVVTKIYTSLGTRSAQVRDHAIARVGQTTRYWDSKMADAVIAAWWGATNP